MFTISTNCEVGEFNPKGNSGPKSSGVSQCHNISSKSWVFSRPNPTQGLEVTPLKMKEFVSRKGSILKGNESSCKYHFFQKKWLVFGGVTGFEAAIGLLKLTKIKHSEYSHHQTVKDLCAICTPRTSF